MSSLGGLLSLSQRYQPPQAPHFKLPFHRISFSSSLMADSFLFIILNPTSSERASWISLPKGCHGAPSYSVISINKQGTLNSFITHSQSLFFPFYCLYLSLDYKLHEVRVKICFKQQKGHHPVYDLAYNYVQKQTCQMTQQLEVVFISLLIYRWFSALSKTSVSPIYPSIYLSSDQSINPIIFFFIFSMGSYKLYLF